MLYEMNRYEPVPSFITTDSLLHNYHLFFSHLLRVVEKEELAPTLKELTQDMLSEAEKQYEALKGTEWENAAAEHGLFAVAGGSWTRFPCAGTGAGNSGGGIEAD